nr:hypothetical protein [uncultured Dorea sp.]
MDNVIKANIKSQDKTAFTRSVWQYDYGQILQITGVELPPAVEVQFALAEKSGETITRVANTVDGVTEVQIPNELLKRDGCMGDYFIYAFIFVSNKDSGNTKYEIQITVKKRPKPEEPTDEPEQEENLFHATVVAVNAAADRAESAVKDAEEIRDNLNLDLSEKITRPRSAEVGQVLAVKAVDEDGKPTEIEAQDIKVPTKTSQLENDSGFLTEHQDISGKLDKEKLPEAIDDALAQAKESGEFDGKDGAPGEQGPKGDPGETTYIENPYDDTKLKTEVDKKLTTPTGNAKVGQILRVQSVNDDGSVVLETVEMPTESVSDIQINGNSIVGNSGIAEIPIGSQGKPGVLGIPGGTYGLDKDDTNNIRIIGLTNGEVDKRFYAKPVMGNTLDYAVKAAMCDGKGNAWTVDEQAAARERMDAEQGSYRFIADMVLEEDTSSIVIDKDLSGEPLSLKTARVIVQHPVPRESDKDNGYVLINNTGVYYGAVDWKASDQVTVAMVDVYVYGENAPAFVTFSSAVPIQIAQNKNSVVSYGNEVQYFEKINVITVLANYYIDKGARIIILGKE